MEVVLGSVAPAVDLNPRPEPGLEWNGVHFAGIRHHSPACATALGFLLREIEPRGVLVEGPREFDPLLGQLTDDRVRCPVAVFTPGQDDQSGWFFPLCESSPEWVALRYHRAAGVPAHFIDLSPAHRPRASREGSRSLMDESRLAHSRWVQAMVARTGCRDHDELWDRMFELRTLDALEDWRGFFQEVHTWCALGRSAWETDALEEEGDLDREACMVQEIRRHREEIEGPLVVVTGGFHTGALLEALRGGGKSRKPQPVDGSMTPSLIRYGFREMDALAGYASGMPSPAFQQAVYDGFRRGERNPSAGVCRDFLLRWSRETRRSGSHERVGTPAVEAAVVQAQRLAALRDLVAPGRSEWMDAAHSCFLKEARQEARGAFAEDLLRLLGGSAMGDLPPSSASPPLLEDARRQAKAAKVDLESTTRRTATLDLHRKPAHRERERFFRLATWLEVPLATWQSGPDLMTGTGLDLLNSRWQVAWNPLVESRLCELAREGASLQEVATRRLLERLSGEAKGATGPSGVLEVVQLACTMGILRNVPSWREQVATREAEEDSFPVLVDSCRRLVVLREVRDLVDFPDPDWLETWLARFWTRSVFSLDTLVGSSPQGSWREREDRSGAVVEGLVTLRDISRDASQRGVALDEALFLERLGELAATGGTPGLVAGAASALLAVEGADPEAMERTIAIHLGTGADHREATDFLRGILRTAPELLLREGKALRALHERIETWEEDRFLELLPELRRCFQTLDPSRIDQIADRVHDLMPGAVRPDPFVATKATERQILSATFLEAGLAAVLDREGLLGWLDGKVGA